MTNAEYIQKNAPEMSLAALAAAAEEWYGRVHPLADAETAGQTAKLTAWLAAEAEETEWQPTRHEEAESTIVTTLQVTHVVGGDAAQDPEELAGLARVLAQTAVRCAWAGYHEHVMSDGHPDNIRAAGVQVFSFDGLAAAEEPEGPEGSEG